MEFEPKKVICNLSGDSFKYTCKNIHLDSQGHEVCNTYRFVGIPLLHLIRNQEDYDELVSLEMFEDYSEEEEVEEVPEEVPEVEEEVEKQETKAQRKKREKEEKKLEKETEQIPEEDEVPEVE